MANGLGIYAAALALAAVAQAGAKGTGNADYPPEALAKRQQGLVVANLTVGVDGRVKDCAVILSSNSAALDRETCKDFENSARFSPARDESGAAVESHVLGRINWVIPGCAASKQADPHSNEEAFDLTVTSLQHC